MTWRDALWDGEKEFFDAERWVVVISVEQVDVYLERTEQTGRTQQSDI